MKPKILCSLVVVVTLLVIVGLVGCEQDGRSPGGNLSSPVDAGLAGNFAVVPATGNTFGIALGANAFRVRSLAGDYLLTYTTQLGTFYIPYRALATAKLTIGLQPGDTVVDVTLQPGTITDISQGTALEGETVIALPWPGSGTVINWQDAFSADMSLSMVVLVRGGQVVESAQVEDMTGGQSNTFGVYTKEGMLQLYVPQGDYLVEYTTMYGTFHVVFRATWQTFVNIPLQSGDTVLNVSIRRGMIPFGVEPLKDQGKVKIYAWPGASPTRVWSDVFVVNVNISPIFLIQEGEIVTTNPFVIALAGINVLPPGFDPGVSGEFGGGGDDDDDDDSGGVHAGGIIIIIIIIG